MARTIIVIDIDESLYRIVETAAREMDISPETYLSMVTEQYTNRTKRKQENTPEAPEPSEPVNG